MNLNGNKKDYLNRTKIWGIEDQGTNYVPLYEIDLFVATSFYGTDIFYGVSRQFQ